MKYISWIICICALPGVAFAGLATAERKSQFEKALSLIITTATPDVAADDRKSLIKAYMDGKRNKGLAVQNVYRRYFWSELHEDQISAGDRTLEGCQLRSGMPCALIAVNDEIAAEGQLIYKDMPRLYYAGEFDLAQIPIIRSITRSRSDLQKYFGGHEPKAIAIHPWGELFIASAATLGEAEQIVLGKCNKFGVDKGEGPCFIYAVNNNVVLPERLTQPK
jgi:hypothetical protein